jgi:hypothetical protein
MDDGARQSGSGRVLAEARELRAGPFSALFAAGDLRYLKVDGVEVLRRIFVGVRDDAWGIVPGVIAGLAVEEDERGFRVRFVADHHGGEVHFRWRGTIQAEALPRADGIDVRVRYEMTGSAAMTFRTNRAGVCVLHPIRGCAGVRCDVEHADGSIEPAAFPDLIAPREPFTNIRALTHEPAPGLKVEVRFEGEVFESEDQRNWTDGSFKTYGRPLAWPFPYVLEAGSEVRQAVTARITGHRSSSHGRAGCVGLRFGGVAGPLPGIGLRLAADPAEPSPAQAEKLRLLNLSHLRADIMGTDCDVSSRVRAISRISGPLGLPVELGLHLSPRDDRELEVLSSVAASRDLRVVRWLVYARGLPVTPAVLVSRVRDVLRGLGHESPVGGGTVGNFAELNRHRPPEGAMEVLAYPVSPQVHATDDLSLFENLDALAGTVRTARAFAPGVPLAVGPVRFHRRPDPFAMGKSGIDREPELPDPRQRTALCAAWTLGAIGELAEAGADFISLYETVGPFGVMEGDETFPAWRVLAGIGEFAGAQVLRIEIDDPLKVTALALRRGGLLRLLVANLTGGPLSIHLEGGADCLPLGPRELVCLDGERGQP